MAKARRMAANPVIRGRIRLGVRQGKTNAEIYASVSADFPSASPSAIGRETNNERARQQAVDTVTAADKRRTIDLGATLRCPKSTNRVRVRITITWTDPKTGETHTFGDTVEIGSKGRLADLLNDALNQVMASARSRGYQPQNVTSASTSGRARYRIEYLECI